MYVRSQEFEKRIEGLDKSHIEHKFHDLSIISIFYVKYLKYLKWKIEEDYIILSICFYLGDPVPSLDKRRKFLHLLSHKQAFLSDAQRKENIQVQSHLVGLSC